MKIEQNAAHAVLRTMIAVFSMMPLALVAGEQAIGTWLTENGQARIEIVQCGAALCGHTVWLAEPLDEEGQPKRDSKNPDASLRGRSIIGETPIVWDMKPAGDGQTWQDGYVYDPENGKTYRARMQLDGADTLRLRGYIGRPIFGRTTVWTRVSEAGE